MDDACVIVYYLFSHSLPPHNATSAFAQNNTDQSGAITDAIVHNRYFSIKAINQFHVYLVAFAPCSSTILEIIISCCLIHTHVHGVHLVMMTWLHLLMYPIITIKTSQFIRIQLFVCFKTKNDYCSDYIKVNTMRTTMISQLCSI